MNIAVLAVSESFDEKSKQRDGPGLQAFRLCLDSIEAAIDVIVAHRKNPGTRDGNGPSLTTFALLGLTM